MKTIKRVKVEIIKNPINNIVNNCNKGYHKNISDKFVKIRNNNNNNLLINYNVMYI